MNCVNIRMYGATIKTRAPCLLSPNHPCTLTKFMQSRSILLGLYLCNTSSVNNMKPIWNIFFHIPLEQDVLTELCDTKTCKILKRCAQETGLTALLYLQKINSVFPEYKTRVSNVGTTNHVKKH